MFLLKVSLGFSKLGLKIARRSILKIKTICRVNFKDILRGLNFLDGEIYDISRVFYIAEQFKIRKI